MQTITCTVDGQTLTGIDIPAKVITLPVDYLRLAFDLKSVEWLTAKLVLELNGTDYYAVTNHVFQVPNTYATMPILKVRLCGYGRNGLHTKTNSIYIEQEV